MRQRDRNGASIKVLLIVALLLANCIVALSRHESAAASRAADAQNPRYSGQMHAAADMTETVNR
jgi:hypothetical protein